MPPFSCTRAIISVASSEPAGALTLSMACSTPGTGLPAGADNPPQVSERWRWQPHQTHLSRHAVERGGTGNDGLRAFEHILIDRLALAAGFDLKQGMGGYHVASAAGLHHSHIHAGSPFAVWRNAVQRERGGRRRAGRYGLLPVYRLRVRQRR